MSKEKNIGLPDDEEEQTFSAKKVVGTSKSFLEDFKGVFFKRMVVYQRDPKRFLQQTILPCILFAVGFYICQGAYQHATAPAL
jgi:hypothetical protein